MRVVQNYCKYDCFILLVTTGAQDHYYILSIIILHNEQLTEVVQGEKIFQLSIIIFYLIHFKTNYETKCKTYKSGKTADFTT